MLGDIEATTKSWEPSSRISLLAARPSSTDYPLMIIDISESVGSGASNRAQDVRAVQAALKRISQLTRDPQLDPGPIDGDAGVGTEGAIEQFQRRLGFRKPDARIDAGGTTLKRLGAWLGIGDLDVTYPFSTKSEFAFFGPGAGMRAFGARRSKGKRAHAGVDLYFPDFTPVLAMVAGVVTRGPYPFYAQTFAVEIDHGSLLARYGEIAPDETPPVQKGDPVERGQEIGRVGVLKRDDGSRLMKSGMLHLEFYDKTQTGRLSRKQGTSARNRHSTPFMRRRDLIDPSGLVSRASLPD